MVPESTALKTGAAEAFMKRVVTEKTEKTMIKAKVKQINPLCFICFTSVQSFFSP